MKMANVNTKIFKSLNESEYKELYTPKRTLTEATTDADEIAEEYKEAYHIDLDWNRVPCVIARDKFLSGWGGAEGKTHYQVVLCGDSTEAANIEDSMKSAASKEGLANIRRDFGVHLSSKVSKAYVVGRYASAWNTLSDSWYERFDGKPSDEDKFNATMDKRMKKLKRQQANESESIKANPIIKNPEFWWLDNDTFTMEFGYSRDDDGWYNYMVEYWADDNTYHFFKVYEYDTLIVEFPEEKKNEIIKMMEEKMNEKQVNESEELNESKVYRDTENPSDYIVLSDSGELEKTSAGDIINFGKVCGFNKVNNTTYLVVKDDDSKIYLYSIDTGFPFTFELASESTKLGESEKLEEKYSEKLGGDPEDFIKDVETIKAKLEEIDTNSFGAKLSQQMVWDWIETCDSQISMTKSRFLGESEDIEEFKKKYKKSFDIWKKENPQASDKEIVDILKAKQYNGELTEDEDTIHKMKDCIDDVKVIMALEGDTLELDDMEDWNRLKELAKSLSRSQGFYGRLLASMEEAEKEGLSFPIYL